MPDANLYPVETPAAGDVFLVVRDLSGGWHIALVDLDEALWCERINPQTGDYDLVAGDLGKLVTLDDTDPIALGVPTNASVPFPVGARVTIMQKGTGQVTVIPAGGVTVIARVGMNLIDQGSGAALIKLATNTWWLIGDLEA